MIEWFVRVWRAENDILKKKALTETIRKKRPLGGQRTRQKDVIEKDVNMLGRNVSVEQCYLVGKGEENCLWQLRSYKNG